MTEIWVVLAPILLADIVNPVLFAFLVYAAGTGRPVLNSSLVLLGHTVAYFSAGVVLALGYDSIVQRLMNPRHMDFVIGLVIGVLLLWVAVRSRSQTGAKEPEYRGELTPVSAFGTGAVVNFVGIPFALPYFAALDQVLKSDLTAMQALSMLVVYNLLYALPFAIVPVLSSIYGEQSRQLLQRINAVLDRVSGYLMPVLLAVVGLALIADALKYFVTGEGLF
jgi:threonine/homoserine/homoserine lactone efflux protein